MSRIVAGVLLLVLALICWSPSRPAHAAEPEVAVRRFALLVGANDGGTEREQLRYAATDAELLGKALLELGGVEAADRVVLVDPDVAALEQGFATMQAKIERAKQAGARVQFFFYYSGHSDETGLLLGGVHFDYKRLRNLIDKVSADVRIGVLDSCSSAATSGSTSTTRSAASTPPSSSSALPSSSASVAA